MATATDPLDWEAIARALKASGDPAYANWVDPQAPLFAATGSVGHAEQPTPGVTGPYAPAPGADPEWEAWVAGEQFSRTQTEADTELRRQRAQAEYSDALRELEQRGLVGRRNLQTNMLGRGVFRSGEDQRRQMELGQTLGQARTATDTGYANQVGDIDADRLRALNQLDVQREQQAVASRVRISDAELKKYLELQAASAATDPGGSAYSTGTSGGGGGGGSTTQQQTAPAATGRQPTSLAEATQNRNVSATPPSTPDFSGLWKPPTTAKPTATVPTAGVPGSRSAPLTPLRGRY